MRLTRADRSVLSDWWFTVDRLMFFGLLLLMGTGLVLSLAASPPIAAKYNLEPFYFVRRHAALLLPSVAIMFAASTLTPKQIRRTSLVIFVVGIALMALFAFLRLARSSNVRPRSCRSHWSSRSSGCSGVR